MALHAGLPWGSHLRSISARIEPLPSNSLAVLLTGTIVQTIAQALIVEDDEPGPRLIAHRAPKRRTSQAITHLAGAGLLPSDALLF